MIAVPDRPSRPESLTIRPATDDDWPAIWAFMQPIVAAGETYCWDRDTTSDQARAIWVPEPPGRTLVAVTGRGRVVGTAEMQPNQGGGGAHVANAGFMVDAGAGVRGVGRALAEHVLEIARSDGYLSMQFNAVVETNVRAVALWRSLGFDVLATVPEAFAHPSEGLVGLHIMHRWL
jgi:ribosomal protein S18 acetylase RimI-like enzyme